MKRVFVNARYLTQPFSGVQNFAQNISLTLKSLRPDIHFLTPDNIVHLELANRLGAVSIGQFTGQVWEQFDLPSYLKKNGNPLLINLCNTAPLHYKNQFNTIHDLAFEKKESWFTPRYKYYYRWLMPQVAKNCLKLLTVSHFSASEIETYYGIEKSGIFIISNSISQEMEENIASPKVEAITENYFLTVGTLDPRKNLKTTIAAFNSLKLESVKLKIIGKSSGIFQEAGITREMLANPMIEWIQDADNVQLVNYYKKAVGLINLSFYEGFGLNNLEAMACGCPVIAADIPVFHEVCDAAAFYINPQDEKALAVAMLNLMHESGPAERMKKDGIIQSLKFSRSQQADKLLNLISDAGY